MNNCLKAFPQTLFTPKTSLQRKYKIFVCCGGRAGDKHVFKTPNNSSIRRGFHQSSIINSKENDHQITKPILPNIKIPQNVQENLKFNEVQFYKLIEKHHDKELKYISSGTLIGFSLITIALLMFYLQNDKESDSLKSILDNLNEIDHEKISNIMKWLKLNNRDGVELLRNYLPLIIEQFAKECKIDGNSKLISEFTSLLYCILKCDQNAIKSNDIEIVKDSIKQLLENGFKFTSINGNESVEEILKNDKFENVSIQLSGFINTIKIAQVLDININIKDIEQTIENLNNRNLILSKLQNDYENRIGTSLEKIQRGIEITQEEKEYMSKLENKYENPNANSESFFLSSFIMELYKKQMISRDDLKNNETVMNFLRREFKGNNHLSYIPAGYLLLDLDDISKESIFNSRLPSLDKEQALLINTLRTELIKVQHDYSVLDKHNFKISLDNFKTKAKGTYLEPFVDYLIISNFGFTGEIEVMKKEVLLYESINHESNCGPRDINIMFELGNTLLQRNDLGKAFQIFSQIQNSFPFYAPLKGILLSICKPSNFKVLQQNANISNMLLTLDKWDVCYKLRLTIQKSYEK